MDCAASLTSTRTSASAVSLLPDSSASVDSQASVNLPNPPPSPQNRNQKENQIKKNKATTPWLGLRRTSRSGGPKSFRQKLRKGCPIG